MISELLNPYDTLFNRLDQIITSDRAFDIFKAIADTPAPTLTIRYTRAPVIESLLTDAQSAGICGPNLTFDSNYHATGNTAISLGSSSRKSVWAMAHLDIISFLTGPWNGTRYPLTPYCEARQTNGIRDALALTYAAKTNTMEPIAYGRLHSETSGHFFETDTVDLPPATRVVYASEAKWDRDSGMVYGTIDDAFGCTALILSAMVLAHYDADSLIVLTDEEEGVVAAGPQAFSRGSARLINRIAPDLLPDLITITDQHEEVAELANGHFDRTRFGQGCSFAGFSSGTKGGITPPHLLTFQRHLAKYLIDQNILLRENPGYVSRSDCVSAMMATPNIALIGFPAAYTHFIDTPRAHINDLVNLAKVLTIYQLIAQDEAWRAQYLL